MDVARGTMISEEIYKSYLSHLLAGNKSDCRAIVEQLIEQEISVQELYTALFQASMYEVGHLWETHQISVAVEHLATAITEGLLHHTYPILFASERIGKSAIISCVPKEYHQIGAKLIADIFELNGWDSYFLGANTPAHSIIKMIDDKQPDLLGLSISLPTSKRWLEQMIETVQSSFPQLDIIIGGQGLVKEGTLLESQYRGLSYINSIDSLEKMIGN